MTDDGAGSAAYELPMFPLGSVLLPGMLLPLHVFEPRFRVLVDTVLLSDRREFGVVLIERGSEVGGGESRTDIGCAARVLEVSRADDGRVALAAIGVRRIRVERWLHDDPFPQAVVGDWPDDADRATDDGSHQELATALGAVDASLARLLELARQLELVDDIGMPELSENPTERVYQLATLSPLGALDRQRVLAAPDLAGRLALLSELLADQEILLRAELDRREE